MGYSKVIKLAEFLLSVALNSARWLLSAGVDRFESAAMRISTYFLRLITYVCKVDDMELGLLQPSACSETAVATHGCLRRQRHSVR